MLDGWLPDGPVALGLAVAGAAFAWICGRAGGALKLRAGIDTAYTRKLFHFAIFSAATVLHAVLGFAAVNACATGVVAVILRGVWQGDGDPVFEGMARERDEPHRAFFVIVPLASTAAGGLLANLLFGPFALVGYLVTGWGDAIAEPVGRWLGRHPYRVPSLAGVPSVRTLEGSTAVALAGSLAAAAALVLGLDVDPREAARGAVIIGLATAAIEAASPHGLDNLTTLLGAAGLASWLS
jgi:phytol kinase